MMENNLKLSIKNNIEEIQMEPEILQKTAGSDRSVKVFEFDKFRKKKADEEYYRKVEESVEKLKEKYC
jgi:hypothetical protein